MNLDLLLVGDTLLNEEESHVLSEVTLKLNNHALLFILNYCPVAMEHFLEGAE